MTKTLLLLRHAKSSWDDPSLGDFDRPLSERGRGAAPRIGAEMARRGWIPDTAIVSPSLRTRQTWDLVASQWTSAIPAAFEPAVYEAPATRILAAIGKTRDEIRTLLVVGHNPGLEELALMLAADDSDAEALADLRQKFPTGALARLTFDVGWSGLGRGRARLTDFVRPKDIS